MPPRSGFSGALLESTPRSAGFTLRVSDRALRFLFFWLFTGNALLIVMTGLSDLQHPLANNSGAMQLDLKREGNVAVWYSSALLLLLGIAAYAVGRVAAGADRDRWVQHLWTAAALFFLWLSMDETAQLHEKMGELFSKHVGTVPGLTEGGWPVFAWLLVFLPVIIAFIACLPVAARWCRRLSARARALLLAGGLCWVGVIGAEFLQAQQARWAVGRGLQGAIEEGLEIVGATLLLLALVEVLRAADRKPIL